MRQLPLFALLVLSICSTAQAKKLKGQPLIDSLQKELVAAKTDTLVIAINVQIAKAYFKVDKDSTKYYATKTKRLAKEIDDLYGLETSTFWLGKVAQAKRDYKVAIPFFKELLASKLERNDTSGIRFVSTQLSSCFNGLDMLDSTVYYADKANRYTSSKKAVAIRLGWTAGVIMGSGGSNAAALTRWLKAVDIYKELGMTYNEGYTYASIVQLYSFIGNDSMGHIYAEKALDILLKDPNANNVSHSVNQISTFYSKVKYYDKAHELNDWTIAVERKNGHDVRLANMLNQRGLIYTQQEKYKEALKAHLEAYDIAKKYNYGFLNYTNSAYLATVYNKLGKYTLALKHINKALKLSTAFNNIRNIVEDYEVLVEVHENRGDYKSAYKAQHILHQLKDSISKNENNTEVARLETRAIYRQKMATDSLQNIKNQEDAARKLSRQRRYTFAGIGGTIFVIIIALFIFKERRKSDRLLHNILPEAVASELKDRGATTAQQYDNATVLFTDFVNFTTAGERMGSQGLVEELHNCFKAFDEIMSKYDIEKIKTIGDAYLAVCGLPTANEQHAEKVVQAAQEIRAFMVNRHQQLGDKTFEVRIGVHSGDVVAGIVGVKKFAYDIWGDTVNTAARMEQNSEAGKINISQTTYELVQDKFTCTYRGELEAKNKGKLKMYFVEA